MFLGLLDPDPFTRGLDPYLHPAPDPTPDPSLFSKGIEQTEIMLANKILTKMCRNLSLKIMLKL
jgi:hypothetical protein